MSDNEALKWLQRRAENSKKPAQTATFGFQRPQCRTLVSSSESEKETPPDSRETTASRLSKFSFRPATSSQSVSDENADVQQTPQLPEKSDSQQSKFTFKPSQEKQRLATPTVEAPLTKTGGQAKFGLPGLVGPPPGAAQRQQQQPWRPEAPVPKRPRVQRSPPRKFGVTPHQAHQPRRSPPPSSRNRGATPQAPPPGIQTKGAAGSEDGPGAFRTAHEQLILDDRAKGISRNSSAGYGQSKRTLGVARSGSCSSGFKPPIPGQSDDENQDKVKNDNEQSNKDERYKNIDDKMIELITNEIMDKGTPIHWDDIAGLEYVKTTVKEVVVFPLLRPDIFCGLRSPPKGILLFGPPGTGKTLIGKCIASQSKSTFFSISASSLTSKWVGEGEKMVRALFAVARVHQPSVVFIDEIDSLLSARSDNEHESSRRIKTEFLVQLDGCSTVGEERILIVGATNRPQDLDEAARRRLVKRLYVPLPDEPARKQIVQRLLSTQTSHNISPANLDGIGAATDGYSGADMANLAKEAAMGPIRSLDYSKIDQIDAADVRPISGDDFTNALRVVKPSVSNRDLELYLDWNSKFGCGK